MDRPDPDAHWIDPVTFENTYFDALEDYARWAEKEIERLKNERTEDE